jgi:hypothetical protein
VGLFDFFKGKSGKDKGDKGDSDKKEAPKKSSAARWAEAAASKRAQAPDRQEALQELAKLKTSDAVEALLKRFTFAIDPSITDQEEKEFAYEGIIGAGKDAALEPIRAFAMKAESVQYPIKILKELCDEDEVVDELIKWLARWDTEYAKFMDPKLQLLDVLGDYKNPKVRPAVEPFLGDFTEEARYRAVQTILAQKEPESLEKLLDCLLDEESVRTKNKILDGIAALGWEVPEERRDPVRKALPYEYGIDGAGKISKRG